MPGILDKSVDMVLADLPYGQTLHKWDCEINLELLWPELLRITKDYSALVFTATNPFSSRLVMSKPEYYRNEWIWEKEKGVNHLLVNFQPYRVHEHILVFSVAAAANRTKKNTQKPIRYTPQFTAGAAYSRPAPDRNTFNIKYDLHNADPIPHTKGEARRYPRSVIKFNKVSGKHPTQKPAALFEYLIKTYTNEGDTVLDPTAGSGTTAVACRKTNRHYICIEKEPEYCAIAERRVKEML